MRRVTIEEFTFLNREHLDWHWNKFQKGEFSLKYRIDTEKEIALTWEQENTVFLVEVPTHFTLDQIPVIERDEVTEFNEWLDEHYSFQDWVQAMEALQGDTNES